MLEQVVQVGKRFELPVRPVLLPGDRPEALQVPPSIHLPVFPAIEEKHRAADLLRYRGRIECHHVALPGAIERARHSLYRFGRPYPLPVGAEQTIPAAALVALS